MREPVVCALANPARARASAATHPRASADSRELAACVKKATRPAYACFRMRPSTLCTVGTSVGDGDGVGG